MSRKRSEEAAGGPRKAIDRGRLSVGWLTDRGLNPDRPLNEDAFFVPDKVVAGLVEERGRLYAVADGMGGEAAGEVASRLGVEKLGESYYSLPWAGGPGRTLTRAALAANEAVAAAAQEPDRKGMGSTLVALVVVPGRAFVGNIGDSRCYLVRDREILQLTEDHTLVARLVRKGLMTPEEARNSPKRNIISRYLGMDGAKVDLLEVEARPGDVFLLTSDGVHGVLSDEELLAVLTELPPDRAPGRIVELVKERGAPDNATVIIVGIGGEAPAAGSRRPGRRRASGRTRARALVPAVLALAVLAVLVILGLRAYLGHWPGIAPRVPVPADTAVVPDTRPAPAVEPESLPRAAEPDAGLPARETTRVIVSERLRATLGGADEAATGPADTAAETTAADTAGPPPTEEAEEGSSEK